MPANLQEEDSASSESGSSTVYKSVPVREDTHTRLTAFKKMNPLVSKSFDDAVNELLDAMDFPDTDEIESMYIPMLGRQESPESDQ